jgi:Flp pilus assembly protein TadD
MIGAESAFRKALVLDPNNAGTFYNFAVYLKDLGRSQEAEDAYRQAIYCRPSLVTLRLTSV